MNCLNNEQVAGECALLHQQSTPVFLSFIFLQFFLSFILAVPFHPALDFFSSFCSSFNLHWHINAVLTSISFYSKIHSDSVHYRRRRRCQRQVNKTLNVAQLITQLGWYWIVPVERRLERPFGKIESVQWAGGTKHPATKLNSLATIQEPWLQFSSGSYAIAHAIQASNNQRDNPHLMRNEAGETLSHIDLSNFNIWIFVWKR